MRNNQSLKAIRIPLWLFDIVSILGLVGGLWLKGIYAQLSTKINKVPWVTKANLFMYVCLLLTILMVFSMIVMLAHKWSYRISLFMAIFLGLLILGDTWYGRYYYNPITTSILNQVSMANDIFESAMNLVKWKDLIFLLDFIVIFVLRAFVKRTMTLESRPPKYLVQAGLSGLFFLIIFGSFQMAYSMVDTSKYVYERKYMAKELGLLYYHAYDVVDYAKDKLVKKELTEEEIVLVESVNGMASHEDNTYTGVLAGRNLIVIQLEAIMGFLIDYEVEGDLVMPFLHSLKNQSLYMSNTYVQTANGNTVDAELLMNASLVPTYRGSVYYEYPNNTYQALPGLLKEQGYATMSFHGYEASFWNREVMHKVLGFERFYSLDDFELDEYKGWAISDASFYRQSLDFIQERALNQPFYGMMITLSSHYPYDGFYSGPFTEVAASEGILNRYYNSARYVDETLQVFFEDLKKRGLYENTTVLIYGDHSGLFNEEAIQQTSLDGRQYTPSTWANYLKTPVFIHAPGVFDEGMAIDQVTGQMDILPTLLNLMGLKLPFTFGQDVLSEDYESLVVKRFGDVITNEMIYISDEGAYYDRISGEAIDGKPFEAQMNRAKDILRAADVILQDDYFKDKE